MKNHCGRNNCEWLFTFSTNKYLQTIYVDYGLIVLFDLLFVCRCNKEKT